VAIVGAAALLAGCGWLRASTTRSLPADRTGELRYVALGDSTVEGIGASSPEHNYVSLLALRLRGVYPRASVENLGGAGATSADALREQLLPAVAARPALVTLSIGPNDITEGVRVEQYERNIDAILGRLRRDTAAVVIVNLLPDLAVTPRFRGREAQETVGRLTVRFNEALSRRAREHGAVVVDLYAASREEVPAHPDLLAADGYPPSDAGYRRWAGLMWQGIEARIPRG
jgi:acyl-CoA thioesterase I